MIFSILLKRWKQRLKEIDATRKAYKNGCKKQFEVYEKDLEKPIMLC